jgi:micrococcal nuclease
MQILRIVSLAGMAVVAYGQGSARPEVVEVRAVVDGHTIDTAGPGRIRLAGIHAPRIARGATDGEPYGREARERLEGIVTHRFVRLEFPSAASRSSAYVLLEDGTFVNALLVREGLAQVSGRPTGARGEELRRAQELAIQARRGLWSAPRQFPTSNAQRPINAQLPTPNRIQRPTESPTHNVALGVGR